MSMSIRQADRKVFYGNFTSDGRNTTISYNKRDWTNSTMDGKKNPIIWTPNRNVVHRWNVLKYR